MSKKLQVNDILAASDIDYIDTLENENIRLCEEMSAYHERLREAIQAERKRWVKEDAEALRKRDIEQQIKGVRELVRLHAGYDRFGNVVIEEEFAIDYIKQLSKELEK